MCLNLQIPHVELPKKQNTGSLLEILTATPKKTKQAKGNFHEGYKTLLTDIGYKKKGVALLCPLKFVLSNYWLLKRFSNQNTFTLII